MDNLTHTLLATALSKTPLGRRSPLAAPAMWIAANLPDADGLIGLLFGKEAYLVHHRGITHSLVGIAAQIVLLSFAVAALERRFFPTSRRAGSGALPSIAIALASHPILDFLNSYGIRPWLPFSGEWVSADLAFIVDPVQWLLFGAATALAGPRTLLGSIGLSILAAISLAVVFLSDRTPAFLLWIWPLTVGALAAARALGLGRSSPRRTIGLAFTLFGLYVGALEWSGSRAVRLAYEGEEPSRAVSRSPLPAWPTEWRVLLETKDAYLERRVPIFGEAKETRRIPKGLDAPLARLAAASDAAEAWRVFARAPIAFVTERANGATVELTDARYQASPGTSWCSVEVTVTREGTGR